ncbi:MAG: lactate racemase domain-containing protein [Bryobacteraceae bacterium]|jgi:nickel-dependent lactate racemase
MSVFCARGSEDRQLSSTDLRDCLRRAFDELGFRNKVLVIPPDFTRVHSCAGELTRIAREYYGGRLTHILPALGTHKAMSGAEIEAMFGDLPRGLFHVHDWRGDLATLGEVPAEVIRGQSEGQVDYSWPVQVNRLLADGGFDLILSIGQVVPHEVAGMAGYNKNLLVGAGGPENIHKSHYLGAVYGMERMMGRADNPVRRVFNYAWERFARHLPVVWALTVVDSEPDGSLATRGLFVGDDIKCFELASELSLRVNFMLLDRPIRKAVVYLDPSEYKSTWLGNKAIYRTRMAMADGGELIVLAPGVRMFGEDAAIDALIRRFGYMGTPAVRRAVAQDADLGANLAAAAHLIHGSSEGRFTITYCPGGLRGAEVEAAGYRYAGLDSMTKKYDPSKLTPGYNRVDGEEVFFINNPGLGLWAWRDRFSDSQEGAA